MHSDIDAVERMDIIRDLRLGEFDALIGINLLREGLDIPEVSLVAVLDADKEGFLRSARSLIQTVGRAARNVKGMAIFYADTITDSMKQTMEETARRRKIQDEFNQAHGITPQQIKKKVVDVMEVALNNSEIFKAPSEERDLPSLTRDEWEAQHGIDSLKGTKRGKRKSVSLDSFMDPNELSAINAAQKGAKDQAATPKKGKKQSPGTLAQGQCLTGDKKVGALVAVIEHSVLNQGSAAAGEQVLRAKLKQLEFYDVVPTVSAVVAEIDALQKRMIELARELKFEEAAHLRDVMRQLEQVLLLLPGRE